MDTNVVRTPDRRVIAFVDNAGADIVLGMLPLARELLRMGSEVYICTTSDCTSKDSVSLLLKKDQTGNLYVFL